MPRTRDPKRRTFWRECIRSQAGSGLTIKGRAISIVAFRSAKVCLPSMRYVILFCHLRSSMCVSPRGSKDSSSVGVVLHGANAHLSRSERQLSCSRLLGTDVDDTASRSRIAEVFLSPFAPRKCVGSIGDLASRIEASTERRRRRLSPFAPRKHAVRFRDWPLGSRDPPSIGDVFLSPFAPRKIPVSIGDPPIGSQDLPSIGDVFLSPFAPRRTALFMIDTRL